MENLSSREKSVLYKMYEAKQFEKSSQRWSYTLEPNEGSNFRYTVSKIRVRPDGFPYEYVRTGTYQPQT